MSKRVQHKAIAYLLIINLIGSLFVPSLVSAMGAETRVLLCTSQGYQWVTLEAEQELNLADNTQVSEHCVVCLSSNDDLDQVVFAYNYQDLVPVEYLFVIRPKFSPPTDHFLITRQSRAPPFFI